MINVEEADKRRCKARYREMSGIRRGQRVQCLRPAEPAHTLCSTHQKIFNIACENLEHEQN